MKSALFIAFHFPPSKMSSGLQRTLSFTQHLSSLGWRCSVLSANPRAYPTTGDDQLSDIPSNVNVTRAFALDAATHLSFRGKYFDLFALPDRWSTWWIGGVVAGLCTLYRTQSSIIWSTYPIATAHLIGLTLRKITGRPWVADFRDSMVDDSYPKGRLRRKVFLWIEKKTVFACEKAVFTAPGTIALYKSRYPQIPTNRWVLIPNGYDERIFSEVEANIDWTSRSRTDPPLTLVHTGTIYGEERDPTALLHAIADLKRRKEICSSRLRVILRGTGHDALFRPTLQRLDVEDIVELAPHVPYRDALREMLFADGLILLQGKICNHQIPAKLYEYFRAKRPILGITDLESDTARALEEAGIYDLAPLDDSERIAAGLLAFVEQIKADPKQLIPDHDIKRYSRAKCAETLASLFYQVIKDDTK